MILFVLQIDEQKNGRIHAKSLIQQTNSSPVEIELAQAAAIAAAKALSVTAAEFNVSATGSGAIGPAKAAEFAEALRKR